MIFKPMERLVQTVHLYCTDTNTVSKRTKTRFHMTHSPTSSIGYVHADFRACGMFGANRAPILHKHLHYLQTDRNELPLEPRHLGVPLSASETISEPMLRLVQTMHLYCTVTNTVSKRTETRFHMTHSPTSSIGYVHDDFRAYGMFGANRAPLLHKH
jgi:aminoglycoside N3'-acetyltransferase